MTRSLTNNRLLRLANGWLFGAAILLAGCHGQAHGPASAAAVQPVAANAATHYTCPMHPQIVREAPGQCPICGMDLVPKTLNNAAGERVGAGLGTVAQSPNAAVVSAVVTVRPTSNAPADTLTLPGVVEYDPRRSRAVAARFGGRIERLFVRVNFQPVRQGQKLLELYSPELISAEQEFVFVLENEATTSPLLAGARQKLRLLGLTEIQLHDLARTRQPNYRVAVFSPYDGYVVEMPPAPAARHPESATNGADGAAEMTTAAPEPSAAAPAQLSLTEGAYVVPSQTLFQVVNTAQVWGIFQPTPPVLARLHPGQVLRVTADGTGLPSRAARLDLVEPAFRAGASTAAVRVYLPNPQGQLRRGMRLTATALAAATPTGSFWLPRAAVVDLGTRQVAFVRRGAAFVPVPVQVGQRTTTQVQVLAGLNSTADVAANGQYLIDSEGFVQTAATAAPASNE